jgi:hypothetical protein
VALPAGPVRLGASSLPSAVPPLRTSVAVQEHASAGLPSGRQGLGGKVAAPADGLDCIPAPVMAVCPPGLLAGTLRT